MYGMLDMGYTQKNCLKLKYYHLLSRHTVTEPMLKELLTKMGVDVCDTITKPGNQNPN